MLKMYWLKSWRSLLKPNHSVTLAQNWRTLSNLVVPLEGKFLVSFFFFYMINVEECLLIISPQAKE